jgi:hypothetical protein
MEPSVPSRLAWIRIDPLPVTLPDEQPRYIENRQFRVWLYEVDANVISDDYEVPDSAIHDIREVTVDNEEQLCELLASWSVPVDSLGAPWQCGLVS